MVMKYRSRREGDKQSIRQKKKMCTSTGPGSGADTKDMIYIIIIIMMVARRPHYELMFEVQG